MGNSKNLKPEFGKPATPTMSFRVEPTIKARYEKLKYTDGVRNLGKIMSNKFSEWLDEIETEIHKIQNENKAG